MNSEIIDGVVPPLRQVPAFDAIADHYDRIFTHSIVGKAQRSLVQETVLRHLRPGQRILDLNCGTGEDAIWLASHGMSVLACDISERMIVIAKQKAAGHDNGSDIDFAVCANEELERLRSDAPFDGVLSNFGGLNCTADLAAVANALPRLVRLRGSLFLCMLSRVCAWEILWYTARGEWKKAFRRLENGGTEAKVGGTAFRVYYPSVREVERVFAPSFKLVSWRAIGLALPPSWLASAFHDRPSIIDSLTGADRLLGALPVLRGLGDHLLFHFVGEKR